MKKFVVILSILLFPLIVFGQLPGLPSLPSLPGLPNLPSLPGLPGLPGQPPVIYTLPTVNIETVFYRLANILFYLLVLLSVIFVIIGGITIATSSGDPNRVELGKKIIVFSLVGLIVGALAFGIVNLFYGYIAGR